MLGRDGISVLQQLSTSASIPLRGFNVADEARAALKSIEIDDDETERQTLLVAVRGPDTHFAGTNLAVPVRNRWMNYARNGPIGRKFPPAPWAATPTPSRNINSYGSV